MNYYELIRRPVISEKTTIQKEMSNQVTFEVDKRANRVEIQMAVESLFKVKVEAIQTLHVKGKFKRRGKIIGKRRDWKKAVVKLAPGERIEFFEGI